MHEIICPHCSKAVKIDEAGYANILKQVGERLELAEREKRDAIALAEAKVTNALRRAKMRRFRPCRPSSLPLRWPAS